MLKIYLYIHTDVKKHEYKYMIKNDNIYVNEKQNIYNIEILIIYKNT